MNPNIKHKAIITLLVFLFYSIIAAVGGTIFDTAKTVALGQIATNQFADSNYQAVTSISEMKLLSAANPFFYGWLLILAVGGFAWRKEIKSLVVPVAVICLIASPSNAYYETNDLPEYQEVMPNQSAFLIPLVGETKAGQASFMSEGFLNDNKVAMKRIQVPHTTLKTGLLDKDRFIPASRLLLVDRTPVTREWVTSGDRGTSKTDQGFRFESAESINLSTGIVLSAFVREEDAAKFVYWFGAKTGPNTDDPAVKYASVMNARSLAEVIDDNVRRKVQAVLAREYGKRSFNDAIAQKADIIAIVEKETKDTFSAMGVTISFVGYAEGLTFDNSIQEAINDAYIASKKALRAQALMATVPYEQAMVNVNLINAQADALKQLSTRWDGHVNLPSWVVLPQGLMDKVSGYLGGAAPVKTAAQ